MHREIYKLICKAKNWLSNNNLVNKLLKNNKQYINQLKTISHIKVIKRTIPFYKY